MATPKINRNPFPSLPSTPGQGTIYLTNLPPGTPVLRTLSYQYPLKLIAPSYTTVSRSAAPSSPPRGIQTVFLLTYGGGLVAGDSVSIDVTLERQTRLVLLTQGSTKVFTSARERNPAAASASGAETRQQLRVSIAPGAALCYLPDPVQPFKDSWFAQEAIYDLLSGDHEGIGGETEGSLCVCDWVTEGRRARGERWSFQSYTSKNEVWAVGGQDDQSSKKKRKRLLLRDNLLLTPGRKGGETEFQERVDGLGVVGTLILRGEVFRPLGEFFMNEFAKLPRIGERVWDTDSEEVKLTEDETWRKSRRDSEGRDGVLWTSASVRGFVLVKFGAKEVEGARHWLREMVLREGTVVKEFGERAALCLK